MVEFDNFVFAAPPGTGGHLFVHWCKESGLVVHTSESSVLPFSKSVSGKYRVSLSRHPWFWLRNYYESVMGFDHTLPALGVLSECYRGAWNFDQFIKRYLSDYPGAVGRLYETYICDTTMRYEDMPWCGIEFLQSFDATYRPSDTMKRARFQNPPILESHRELFRGVMAAERDVCDRLEYC